MSELTTSQCLRLAGLHASKADDHLQPLEEGHEPNPIAAMAHATLAALLMRAAELDEIYRFDFSDGWWNQ